MATMNKNRDGKGRFKSGTSGNPNGRPQGSKNKYPINVAEAYLTSLADLGGTERIKKWANKNDTNFGLLLRIIGRMLPTNVVFDQGEKKFEICFKETENE